MKPGDFSRSPCVLNHQEGGSHGHKGRTGVRETSNPQTPLGSPALGLDDWEKQLNILIRLGVWLSSRVKSPKELSNEGIREEILLLTFQQHPLTRMSLDPSSCRGGGGHVGNFLRISVTGPLVRLSRAWQPPEVTVVSCWRSPWLSGAPGPGHSRDHLTPRSYCCQNRSPDTGEPGKRKRDGGPFRNPVLGCLPTLLSVAQQTVQTARRPSRAPCIFKRPENLD